MRPAGATVRDDIMICDSAKAAIRLKEAQHKVTEIMNCGEAMDREALKTAVHELTAAIDEARKANCPKVIMRQAANVLTPARAVVLHGPATPIKKR